ncbi:hypothetical protein KMP13_09585 [Epibacterium ulvae]|uniref:hypothetical protein n=1 Tax=Epibacterium ulvae TaxID=1156985 RepID=UPI001BFC5A47|nr:hypothetical protein [Epibacterium ulvae]MBT8154141.1 hypothetical protein [Epibacterium ulvae]
MKRIFPAGLRISAAVALVVPLMSAPALAQDSKEDSCRYQGEVMSAVQDARRKRVKEENVEARILDSEPEWPEQYSKAIPQLVKHVYAQKRSDLRGVDLGAVFEEQCLANWDQIQQLRNDLQQPSN